ncbi:MurR/RpiR family transcriptional regulator [Alkalicoccobacillus porphyridii]|uniref:MurR/RpiR family transcriptional regulator n=1 Tax=Alkalicoccobacillus porphyridii TaxID=2597270 RepID=A0A554A4H3_9BACI|nr:MurR/RpiR family transcriptional regulator [Alkalicoccobacillus porphyridii]TSB48587.1 MurR/RpiR family transcriptional regulator [Alkalicoccobacillus porphyridii]
MKNPLETLKEKVGSLPRSQKLVVDYIIDHYSEVGFMTVEQLSKKVGTSTTTIMRLMSNVGYSGYSEFQKNLQSHIREETAPQTRFENNLKHLSKNESWLRHYDLQIDQIQKANQLNEASLDDAVKMISSSSTIYCTSVRSGLPVAQYLTHNLNRMLGNTKLTIADSSDWVDDVIAFTENDLLIVVSFARYGERLMYYAEQAKRRGTKVIAITDKFSSPVVSFADIVLACPADSIASHNSIVSSIFIVDYLIGSLSLEKTDMISQRLKEVDGILTQMNYHVQKKNVD